MFKKNVTGANNGETTSATENTTAFENKIDTAFANLVAPREKTMGEDAVEEMTRFFTETIKPDLLENYNTDWDIATQEDWDNLIKGLVSTTAYWLLVQQQNSLDVDKRMSMSDMQQVTQSTLSAVVGISEILPYSLKRYLQDSMDHAIYCINRDTVYTIRRFREV